MSINVDEIVKAAQKEIADESSERARKLITGKLREIKNAERVLANLQQEYEVLLRDLADQV